IIGLKPSRGAFSMAPDSSDLMNVVSAQGCHTRTIRDTAAFVDACRGGAPGEFMPYWTPEEPYREQIKRDPSPLRIAVSHEWGGYLATPEIVSELEYTAECLPELGHEVEWVAPEIALQAAYGGQTAAYIMKFAQTIERLLKENGGEASPHDFVEPIFIRVWAAGR